MYFQCGQGFFLRAGRPILVDLTNRAPPARQVHGRGSLPPLLAHTASGVGRAGGIEFLFSA